MATERDPRRGEAGETFTYFDTDGKRHNIKADDDGVLAPRNDEDEAALNVAGYSIARKAKAAARAEAEQKEK